MRHVIGLLAILMSAGLLLNGAPANAQSAADKVIDTVFSAIEKKVIEDYYKGKSAAKSSVKDDDDDDGGKGKGKGKGKKAKGKGKSKGLPPGLAKKGTLPPGLAKRQTLPPGLQRDELPNDLLSKLPKAPKGTERTIIDNNVVLIEKGTDLVLDILLEATK